MQILITIFTGIAVLLGLVVIVLVMLQTPRNEGLGGATSVAGGNFRGKAGMDEILSNYTRTVAFAWFASVFILGVIGELAGK